MTERDLGVDVRAWARGTLARDAVAGAPQRLGGHGGLTYAVDVEGATIGELRLVLRLAPPGVRRAGSADVLRQVRLLDALAEAGVPVVPVRWWTDDPAWFGTDVIVQDRLPQRSIDMFGDVAVAPAVVAAHREVVAGCAAALASLHAVDWRACLADWASITTPADILDFCQRLLDRSPEEAWAEDGMDLLARLERTIPGSPRWGVVHGDFQTNNVLFEQTSGIAAIVDWELAMIGPVELDLGWFAMMTDPDCWAGPLATRLRVQARPEEVFDWYGAESSPRLWWFYALACLRYGAISCHNVKLHRTGRKVDAFNESMSTTIPVLFERGRWALTRGSA